MRNLEYTKKYSFFLSFWHTSKLKHPKNFSPKGSHFQSILIDINYFFVLLNHFMNPPSIL
ncbi:hypothetical protein LEP1GSC018_1640 [Leptospira kirschneri str. 2008720114]|nr:hypothetical protein LEP1GSC018_1640 [Leptospira kirschneri str. 2008720114]